MAQEVRGDFQEALAARGVTRRDFMKYCGSVAALLGMSEMYAPQIASAIESAKKLQPTLWMAQGLCTGCTESMAQVDSPDVPTIVLDLLSVNYWETVMAAAGKQAEENVKATIEAGGYVAIIEGSIMTAFEGNALRIAGKPGIDEVVKVCKSAVAVIAVGSCAVDGGWCAGEPNPGGATGVQKFLKDQGIAVPVVNVPTCPVNPEWIVALVVDLLLVGGLDRIVKGLDDKGRPKLIFGSTIHDNCPRRGHFENGEFVENIGNAEQEAKQWCLYKIGCKGPQTYTNCPSVRWNRRASWCVESGAPCIGCGTADPVSGGPGNWFDASAPFLDRTKDVRLPGVGGVQPGVIGGVIGAAAAAGIAVHGVATAASGRFSGAPLETEKAYDRKKAAKGGDK
ncbi:MAG: hydrogenase small subunit [Coriobacteriia bacterium]|nr:hydrogenase small subunit [Coriobacteriia bacterium]